MKGSVRFVHPFVSCRQYISIDLLSIHVRGELNSTGLWAHPDMKRFRAAFRCHSFEFLDHHQIALTLTLTVTLLRVILFLFNTVHSQRSLPRLLHLSKNAQKPLKFASSALVAQFAAKLSKRTNCTQSMRMPQNSQQTAGKPKGVALC